jgi:hypothetical protein
MLSASIKLMSVTKLSDVIKPKIYVYMNDECWYVYLYLYMLSVANKPICW